VSAAFEKRLEKVEERVARRLVVVRPEPEELSEPPAPGTNPAWDNFVERMVAAGWPDDGEDKEPPGGDLKR
jgi:hypothetical protein